MNRPVMIYNGGKFLLADWVVENLPEHKVYVEPFGGAGSVLMRKPRAKREVYNDLNDEVVNVFRVLREPAKAAELERQLRLTPFSRAEMQLAKKPAPAGQDIEQARRTIVCAGMRYSKQSNRAPEQDWATYPDEIPAFVERLTGVMIENKDAVELIEFWDSPETLFYCDPPYVHSSRNDSRLYKHELKDEGQLRLLAALRKVQGMVVLSGYASDLYAQALIGWSTVERQAKTCTHRKVTEVLWMNPAAMARQNQLSLEV